MAATVGERTPVLPVPLRPLSALDVVDGAVATLKSAPVAMLAVSAALVVPVQLASAWAQRDHLGDVGLVAAFQVVNESSSTVDTSSLWVLPLSSFVQAVVAVAVATMVVSWYSGDPVPARAALGHAVRRAPVLLVAWFLVHVLEAAGTVALVVPGVLAAAACSVVAPVVAVEPAGPVAALRRSFRLTRARFGAALGLLLLVGVVDVALTFAVTGVGFLASPFDWSWVVDAVLAGVAAVVTTPVVGAAAALLYLDLRVRSEGFDIELGAARAL